MGDNLRLDRRESAFFFYESPVITNYNQLGGGSSHSNVSTKLVEVSEFIKISVLKLLGIT